MSRYRRNWNSSSSNSSSDVSITWNPELEVYETSFPFNKDFIEWIKQNINTNDRKADFDRSRTPQWKWLFTEQVLETILLPLMKASFPHSKFTIIDKKKVDEYNQGLKQTIKIDKDALKLEFRQMVKEAGVDTTLPDKKQYLRACMFYHPDKNPNNAGKMSRLNEIWTTVFEPKTVILTSVTEEAVNV